MQCFKKLTGCRLRKHESMETLYSYRSETSGPDTSGLPGITDSPARKHANEQTPHEESVGGKKQQSKAT